MKKKISNVWALMLALVVSMIFAGSARADAVDTAITSTTTLVTGYVTAIGGALVTIAVLWIGFKVGAKYVKKLGGL